MKPKEKAEQLIKQFKHRNQYSSDKFDSKKSNQENEYFQVCSRLSLLICEYLNISLYMYI